MILLSRAACCLTPANRSSLQFFVSAHFYNGTVNVPERCPGGPHLPSTVHLPAAGGGSSRGHTGAFQPPVHSQGEVDRRRHHALHTVSFTHLEISHNKKYVTFFFLYSLHTGTCVARSRPPGLSWPNMLDLRCKMESRSLTPEELWLHEQVVNMSNLWSVSKYCYTYIVRNIIPSVMMNYEGIRYLVVFKNLLSLCKVSYRRSENFSIEAVLSAKCLKVCGSLHCQPCESVTRY